MNKIETFRDYQKKSYVALNEHNSDKERTLNWTIGVAEEQGEIAGIIKHTMFGHEPLDKDMLAKLAKEIGDELWYLSALCSHHGLDLAVVAELNRAKLDHRYDQQKKMDYARSANRHFIEEKFMQTEQAKEIISRLFIEPVGRMNK